MTTLLLHLGKVSSKRIFATTQWQDIRWQFESSMRQIRHFRRLRDSPKLVQKSFSNVHQDKGSSQSTNLLKPFCFTVLFTGATFVGATIWEYERIRQKAQSAKVYRQFHTLRTGWRKDMENWWNDLYEGQKVFAAICFINVLVFLCWRVPAFQGTMVQYFSSHPHARATCWPMLLSSFSHYSILHLAANMYVLHSFSASCVTALGKEQFVALYLSSGVISGFVSHLYKASLGLRGASLGASGAIMGILGFVCTQYPHIQLSIVFLPTYPFPAGVGIKALMIADSVGCLLRWQYFDHAAHLGGVFWGIFWQKWGNANIWQKRDPILTFWHNFRNSR
ncbi:presenilins-associated rhomboid-like protein, mitochondrial [Orussus abietinus]|uniref:presenilins-associated rhomboid-like protein, mitochondrial n=1 Tax=Orussus abietinus TaxID=222816 RepID=UPI000626A274|nr:presenilins-associated rhomboid-like protein, mitochondrial [Orussus abietinus]